MPAIAHSNSRATVVSYFFFSSRRRHTRWPRDWSSDVCSSDLSDWGPAGLDRCLALGADQVLQDPNLNKLSRTFALLHNARHTEVVVQDLNRVADFNVLGFGEQLVHQPVVRTLKGSSSQIMKGSAQRLITVQINTRKQLQ